MGDKIRRWSKPPPLMAAQVLSVLNARKA